MDDLFDYSRIEFYRSTLETVVSSVFHDTIKYLTTMIQKRIDPVTGREQLWVKPDGLPGLWVTRGYCERCEPYRECLGFLSLSDEEWASFMELIAVVNNITDVTDYFGGVKIMCEKLSRKVVFNNKKSKK